MLTPNAAAVFHMLHVLFPVMRSTTSTGPAAAPTSVEMARMRTTGAPSPKSAPKSRRSRTAANAATIRYWGQVTATCQPVATW